MVVLGSIVPIFLVIALGVAGAARGFFPPGFTEPANRLAYYLAVPALIFRSVAKAPLHEAFQPLPALLALAALGLNLLLSLWLSRWLYPAAAESAPRRASFLQATIHGNQAYLAFAVIFYALGQAGMNAAVLIGAVIIIGQNLLSVVCFTRWGRGGKDAGGSPLKAILANPIILSSLAGLLVSASGVKLPEIADRTLSILAGMGLPLALLIIGANLSQGRLGGSWRELGLASLSKLVVLPGLVWALLTLAGVGGLPATVTVIMLAAPLATISPIMAEQLGGDPLLTSQATTLTHALSAASFALWLLLLH